MLFHNISLRDVTLRDVADSGQRWHDRPARAYPGMGLNIGLFRPIFRLIPGYVSRAGEHVASGNMLARRDRVSE